VIVIIGILVAVALPLYRGHIVMAKLAEGENAMSSVSSGVKDYYQSENSWPNCPTTNAVANSLGVSLGTVTRISQISISNSDGTITAWIQNIDPIVDGKSLTLIPSTGSDGSMTWNWGWSSDFPAQFKPISGG